MTLRKKGMLSAFQKHIGRHRLGEVLVTHKVITPQNLRAALKIQKNSGQSLGRILREQKLVTNGQLIMILCRQKSLRFAAGFMFFFMALTQVSGKDGGAHADGITQISLTASSNRAFSHNGAYPAFLQSSEKRSRNIKAFTKWTDVMRRFERDVQSNKKMVPIKWQKQMVSLQTSSIKQMADTVNTMVNEIRYVTDDRNWGQTDYWATPAEFLSRGGDCEDFAITKYTILRAMGVPEERLRIGIVQDELKNIPHAILIVYTDQGPYILDNQNKNMVRGDRYERYRPIFSINRTAWWLHTPDKGASSTRVASR